MVKTKQHPLQGTQELYKSLVNEIGTLIDARIRTAEITIKANTDASIKSAKEELRGEIKASEERQTKRLEKTTSELREEIKASEKRLTKQIDITIASHAERIGKIESHLSA